jgi:hypothetical protein
VSLCIRVTLYRCQSVTPYRCHSLSTICIRVTVAAIPNRCRISRSPLVTVWVRERRCFRRGTEESMVCKQAISQVYPHRRPFSPSSCTPLLSNRIARPPARSRSRAMRRHGMTFGAMFCWGVLCRANERIRARISALFKFRCSLSLGLAKQAGAEEEA